MNRQRKWRQYFAPAARWTWGLALALLLGQALANEYLFRLNEGTQARGEGEPVRKNAGLYRAMSFGHLPALVDWFWIVSLTDTDIKHVEPGKHSTFFYNIDLMTDLDPLFAEVYTNGANLIAVVQNDGLGAQAILDKGERFRTLQLPHLPESYRANYWSRPWQIPLLLGYVHLFELKNMPNAAIHFKVAAAIPGVPTYVPRLARRLEQPGGEYEVGLKLLNFMMQGATDEKIRKELERKRDNLFISQYLHDLNRDFESFRKTRLGLASSRAWADFCRESKLMTVDPWGGRLSVDSEGKIVTTTPHVPVLGLE